MADFLNLATLSRAGTTVPVNMKGDDEGRQVVVDRVRELATRGKVFSFSVAAVTVPVNANNLVSVCSLYNPPGSGVLLELIEVEAHAVLATTVVGALGLYFQQGSPVNSATFTTRSVAIVNGRPGEGQTPAVQAYSALTHSGTPTLLDLIGGWGAVTDGGATPVRKEYKGQIQLPPGSILSLAMTTAASTASGITALIRWAEIPYQVM